MVTAWEAAGPPRPSTNAPAPVLARICLRLRDIERIAALLLGDRSFSLILLHAEFADRGLDVGYRRRDHLRELRGRRRLRQRAALLDQLAIAGRRHDRH